ncbi:MAG: hypothetical protein ACRDOI_38000 [Trebonia sp.]
MDIYTSKNFAAARDGAAFSGVCMPWANLAAAVGATHAPAPSAAHAVGSPATRWTGLRPIPATRTQSALMATELPAVNETRKQKNVHTTRISAGGYGAMGPHPEREQPA